ncbi:MAG: hypothetical protein ACRDNF_09775, partial [Streptosporangiaceae bacterium]
VGSLILLDAYPAGWVRAVPGDPLDALMTLLGYPPGDPQQSLAAARAPGGVLAGLDDCGVNALVRTCGENMRALAVGTSGVYHGDALLFTSADGAAAPASWQGRITGRLDVCPVPGGHAEMIRPAAVRRIAPLLAARLDSPAPLAVPAPANASA